MDSTDDRAAALDLAALAGPNMSPVIGRYMDRSWSHGVGHRLVDTAGREYLDFANGIAVTSLGHAHPRVTAAVHAQVDRLMGPVHAMGFSEPTVRLAAMLADTFPDPLDSVLFLNSGSETIDAALKLARRVTGRPGIIAFRGAFHGRTFGATSVTTSSLNYRTGYEPLLPGVYFAPYPAAYPEFRGDEGAASASSLAILESLLRTIIAPLLAPGVVVTALFAFITAWNEFFLALVLLQTPDLTTLPLLLARFVGIEGIVRLGPLAASALLATLPSLILFTFIQRWLTRGLMSGAVKG